MYMLTIVFLSGVIQNTVQTSTSCVFIPNTTLNCLKIWNPPSMSENCVVVPNELEVTGFNRKIDGNDLISVRIVDKDLAVGCLLKCRILLMSLT